MATVQRPDWMESVETVVDCDFHVWEHEEDFLPYLEPPFDRAVGTYGSNYLQAGYVMLGGVDIPEERYDFNTQEQVVEGMAEAGVDEAVVSGSTNLYIGCINHNEFAAAAARAYNEWVLDEILDPEKGIHGLMHVAPQAPYEAAEEIDDRADEDAFKGVIVASGGLTTPLGDEKYYPIYEAAQDNDLPVTFHNGAPSFQYSFPQRYRHTSRFIEAHAVSHAMEHMMHLTSMLTHGVFVRYPDIDFVFQEAGLNWIPYIIYRYDNEYSSRRHEAPLLEKTPSEYVKEHCYFTSQPLEVVDYPDLVEASLRSFNGEERMMFASDYPHFDFDHSSQMYKAIRQGFDDDEIQQIFEGTARKVFGL